ncbi:hypothetical protein FHS96_005843 [Sphingomonas zeicaulis]|uniref:hypothetical protein n=1 Tax=Sphingomonas zeicaulis TaxID=1632740 RepID=UPI003D1A13D9
MSSQSIAPLPRSRIEAAVAEIASATLDTFHKARSFLDEHQFYPDAEQCRIVNEALNRIENEPAEVGQIIFQTQCIEPHPAFDATYLSADDAVSR